MSGRHTLYVDIAADGNTQFSSIFVYTDATLEVPSGTVLRCSGACIIQGTVMVLPATSSGGRGHSLSGNEGVYGLPALGSAADAAVGGELGNNSEARTGGPGGRALSAGEARHVLQPGPRGGGGGAGSLSGAGGSGGGSLVVIAKSTVAVMYGGAIRADGLAGAAGAGGGAGGVVILASEFGAVNGGTITARGGQGGNSNAANGAGGGGAGGIVHLLSPTNVVGAVDVGGGAAGTAGAPGSVNAATFAGGGGGGACGGDGGAGGDVSAAGNPAAAQPGAAGRAFETVGDPKALF